MDVAGDEDDRFAVARELRDLLFGQSAGIGQLPRGLPDLLQVPHVPLGGDDGHDEVFAERRLAERLDLHARRGRGQRLEVGDDLPVVGELAVRADLEAEELRRRLDRCCEGGRGDEEEEGGEGAFHAPGIMADRRA